MEKQKLLTIFFDAEIQEGEIGFNPGGAVFPREIVDSVDFEKHAITLKPGWRFSFSRDSTEIKISTSTGHISITVGDEKINDIRINFRKKTIN